MEALTHESRLSEAVLMPTPFSCTVALHPASSLAPAVFTDTMRLLSGNVEIWMQELTSRLQVLLHDGDSKAGRILLHCRRVGPVARNGDRDIFSRLLGFCAGIPVPCAHQSL